jgi:hypothetical protein
MKGSKQWTTLFLLFAVLIAAGIVGWVPRPAAALASCQTGQAYHHDITIDANGIARVDKPAEVRLNLTPLLAAQGGSGAINLNSLCVDEMDGGAVVDNDVPFQFDRTSDYNATSKARGKLTLLMEWPHGRERHAEIPTPFRHRTLAFPRRRSRIRSN